MAFFKKSVFGVISLVALGLVACGDDSGSNNFSFAPTHGDQVGSIYELGQCSAEREGVSVLVTDENTYYLCTSSEWKPVAEYNGPVSSSALTSSSSSAPTEDPSSSSSSVVASSSGTKQSSSSVAGKPTWQYLNPSIDYGEFTDSRDGQVYKTIEICDDKNENCQTWMAQNLNYDPGDVSSMGSYAWSGCYGDGGYDYSSSKNLTDEEVAANCSKYGRLYTWEVAMDKAGCGYGTDCNNSYEGTQGVCPEGWHLPTNTDWQTLFTNVGGTNTVGKLLKANTSLWYANTGTDSFGFAVLPAGYRGNNGDFYFEGYYANFWSSTENDGSSANLWYFYYNNDYVGYGRYDKYDAFSVRCLRDSN